MGGSLITDYREIIRLNHQGVSRRDIFKSCGCSRNTEARILGKAREHGVLWVRAEDMTYGELRELFFPGVAVLFCAYQTGLRAHPWEGDYGGKLLAGALAKLERLPEPKA